MKALGGFGLVVLLALALFGGLLGYRAIRPIVAGEVLQGCEPAVCADMCADRFVELVNEEADRRR